ncbi:hypothetical protein GCM10009754_87340 [Amycolatopsis minnesotensis]|uniref:Uncharacterized protein n=1 Tax=Amycolatopsis minnesotensis TaxID=337894 RepID=A0ABN2SZ19_9PSEU
MTSLALITSAAAIAPIACLAMILRFLRHLHTQGGADAMRAGADSLRKCLTAIPGFRARGYNPNRTRHTPNDQLAPTNRTDPRSDTSM